MIWHIFKKDVRLLWHYALGLAVVRGFETFLLCSGPRRLNQTWELVMIVDFCGAILLIGLLACQDAVPGVRQDWLARPIRRRDLLTAKLLFVVLLMGGPAIFRNWLGAMAHGFSWQSSMGSALAFTVPMLLGFYLPALGFAVLTRNLTETIVGVVGALLILAMLQPLVNPDMGLRLMQFGSGTDWLVDWAELLLLLCGAAAVLSIQYFRRKTWWARGLTAAVALLGLALYNAPWQPLFAIEQRLSPAPGSASAIRITFDPGQGRSHQPMGYRNDGRIELSLPVRISGLPPDSVLKADWVASRLIGRDGSVIHLGSGPAQNDTPATSDLSGHTSVPIGEEVYARRKDQPVRLELDYALTLLHLKESHAIPASKSREMVPEAGECWTSVNPAGTGVSVSCMAPDSAPSCMVLFLENSNTGARNPPVTRCFPNYAPVFAQILPDAIYRTWVGLPFRDASGLARYRVDGSQLWNSNVVMRIYQVEDHFTRRLAIPNVRMSDWVAN